MVEGELLQLDRIGKIGVTEADYMELIDRKTASLFSACARLGAMSAGAERCGGNPAGRIRLESGDRVPVDRRHSGFHVAREDPGQAGGQRSARGQGHAAADLCAGIGRARRSASWWRRCSPTATTTRCRSARFCTFCTATGIERAQERAQAFTEKARAIIAEFPESPYQRALLAVTDLVTDRDH